MALRCDNCGEKALDTDVVCWHCGTPLAGREEQVPDTVTVKESWQRGVSASSIGLMVGMAMFVVVGALVMTYVLGRQPLVQVTFGTRPPSGWVLVTAADKGFTVYLPDSWEQIDGSNPDQMAKLQTSLASDELFYVGTYPFGARVDDLKTVFLAREVKPPAGSPGLFFLVSLSPVLNRLEYDQAVEFLSSDHSGEIDGNTTSGTIEVSEARYIDDFDKSHVAAVVRVPVNGRDFEALICRQQFIHGEGEAMVIAVCSPSGRFGFYQSDFELIMTTFQRLRPSS